MDYGDRGEDASWVNFNIFRIEIINELNVSISDCEQDRIPVIWGCEVFEQMGESIKEPNNFTSLSRF